MWKKHLEFQELNTLSALDLSRCSCPVGSRLIQKYHNHTPETVPILYCDCIKAVLDNEENMLTVTDSLSQLPYDKGSTQIKEYGLLL